LSQTEDPEIQYPPNLRKANTPSMPLSRNRETQPAVSNTAWGTDKDADQPLHLAGRWRGGATPPPRSRPLWPKAGNFLTAFCGSNFFTYFLGPLGPPEGGGGGASTAGLKRKSELGHWARGEHPFSLTPFPTFPDVPQNEKKWGKVYKAKQSSDPDHHRVVGVGRQVDEQFPA